MALTDLRQRVVTEKRNAARALRQQMRGGELAAQHVVGTHRGIGLARYGGTPDDERDTPQRHRVELVVLLPLADHHDAGSAATSHALRGFVQLRGRHARQQHLVAALGQRVGDAADQAQEKRVRQVLVRDRIERHDDGDGAVLPEAQVLRADVDGVVERARQFRHPFARLGVDLRAAGQRARDGRHRHARQPGDVGHLQALGFGGGHRLRRRSQGRRSSARW